MRSNHTLILARSALTIQPISKDMQKFALKTAVAAFNKPDNNAEKDIAAQIKKEFDKEYTVCCPHD